MTPCNAADGIISGKSSGTDAIAHARQGRFTEARSRPGGTAHGARPGCRQLTCLDGSCWYAMHKGDSKVCHHRFDFMFDVLLSQQAMLRILVGGLQQCTDRYFTKNAKLPTPNDSATDVGLESTA